MPLARAAALACPAIAVTFEPHPRAVLRPADPVFRLTDERAKLRLLAATGLAGALVLTFDKAFTLNVTNVNCSQLSPSDVVRCNFNNNTAGSNKMGIVGLDPSSTLTDVQSGA